MTDDKANRIDLRHIQKRVREKLEDHTRYNFTKLQNNLLKSFFDLVQEYDRLDDFYRICVVVLLESLHVESKLYVFNEDEKNLQLVCTTHEGIIRALVPVPTGIYLTDQSYKTDNSFVVPIYRKPPQDDAQRSDSMFPYQHPWHGSIKVLGMFEISPADKLSEADSFILPAL